jgi:endoglucanase
MKKTLQKLIYLLLGIFILFQSCSSDSTDPIPVISITPTDLKVTSEIVGTSTEKPNGDGSGTVKFKATATNATSYQIIIEGKTLPMPNGELTYTFTTAGTNSYTIAIDALNDGKSVRSNTTLSIFVVVGETASAIVKAMGAGFNLGNVFDNGGNPSTIASIKNIVDLYKAAGMKHVRIPVTWVESVAGSTLASTTDGKVNFNHSRFLELKAAIDYALEKDLYVVLNTHHEHWLKDNYDGSAAYDTKFTNLWTDIATYFKGYSNKLIFDVLNEPEGAMGQWGTAVLPTNTTAIELTRKINLVGYNAIRATGGGNTNRIIMVEPNGQGNQGQIDDVYPTKANLPGSGNDKYLAIQVHTYDPWAFCGQTGADSAYPGAASIASAITKVATHSALIGVPVNYGEFGVGRSSNSSSRNSTVVLEYYKTVKTTCIANNMSLTVWDDRGWFGLITSTDKINYSFSNNIVSTMLAP